MTGFIYKLINELIFDYFFKANLKMLSYLFYAKIYKINFNSFYKGFYILKNNVFIILFLLFCF